jgi:hypothetical protein
MRMIGTNRCKRRCRDSARDSRARGDAVPFLEKLGHRGWRSGATARDRRLSERPHVAEALACSLVLTRDDEGAREILRVLKRITLEDDERAGWWAELRRGTRGPVEDDWVVEVWKRGQDRGGSCSFVHRSYPAPRRMERRTAARPTAAKDRLNQADVA